jgi:hypothetical protein
MSTPRMRTIKQLVAEYKAMDPYSAITEHLLRKLVAEGELTYSKAGKKILINADVSDTYFSSGYHAAKDTREEGKIRPIKQ